MKRKENVKFAIKRIYAFGETKNKYSALDAVLSTYPRSHYPR